MMDQDWTIPGSREPLDPARLGKITASSIAAIMGTPRSKGETFTDAAITYLAQKIAERMTGVPEMPLDVAATRWGLDHEAEGLAKLGIDGLDTVQQFIPWGEYCGCTPDGKFHSVTSGLPWGVEIKCPFNSSVFVKMTMIHDQGELKEAFPKYYWQVMSSLMFTGWQGWLFAAYDPRFPEGKQTHAIQVIPDHEAFDLLKFKINLSTNYINDYGKGIQ